MRRIIFAQSLALLLASSVLGHEDTSRQLAYGYTTYTYGTANSAYAAATYGNPAASTAMTTANYATMADGCAMEETVANGDTCTASYQCMSGCCIEGGAIY